MRISCLPGSGHPGVAARAHGQVTLAHHKRGRVSLPSKGDLISDIGELIGARGRPFLEEGGERMLSDRPATKWSTGSETDSVDLVAGRMGRQARFLRDLVSVGLGGFGRWCEEQRVLSFVRKKNIQPRLLLDARRVHARFHVPPRVELSKNVNLEHVDGARRRQGPLDPLNAVVLADGMFLVILLRSGHGSEDSESSSAPSTADAGTEEGRRS